MKTQDYIREFFMIFFIRKAIILWITAGVTAVGLMIAAFAPQVYEANGAIVLKGGQVLEDPTEVGEGVRPEIDAVSEKDLFSEIEILNSFSVFQRAAERLAEEGKLGVSSDRPSAVRSLAGRMSGGFSAGIVPRSNVSWYRSSVGFESTNAWFPVTLVICDAPAPATTMRPTTTATVRSGRFWTRSPTPAKTVTPARARWSITCFFSWICLT